MSCGRRVFYRALARRRADGQRHQPIVAASALVGTVPVGGRAPGAAGVLLEDVARIAHRGRMRNLLSGEERAGGQVFWVVVNVQHLELRKSRKLGEIPLLFVDDAAG